MGFKAGFPRKAAGVDSFRGGIAVVLGVGEGCLV